MVKNINMSWMKNFITKVTPLLKPEFRGKQKKKKTNNTIMTEKRGDWEENTKRSILGTKT